MQLKMTSQQATCLYIYMSDHVIHLKPTYAEEKLLQALMIKIFRKLRLKLEGKFKNGYSLSLSDEEALAYWVYFSQADLSQLPYEQNFIQQHINSLDQKYA